MASKLMAPSFRASPTALCPSSLRKFSISLSTCTYSLFPRLPIRDSSSRRKVSTPQATPIPPGRRLVQCSRLLLQEREVVDGVEDVVVPLVGAPVTSYHIGSATDHHPVHVSAHQHLPVSVGHGYRVVVGAVPHQ